MRLAVYYDLDAGGAAFALARFVRHLRRSHRVDCFAPGNAFPVVEDLHRIDAARTTRTPRGSLYYLNRFTQPAHHRALARAERELAQRLGEADRILVHSCQGRGAPALLSELSRPATFYVTEPLRLTREPRAPDTVAPALWRASRLLYTPVARRLNREDERHGAHAARILANSGYTARRVEEVYGKFARVIYPSVDPAFLGEPVKAAPDGSVFSPGALLPQKGHGRVIRALARLPRESRPPLVLGGFAGRGETLARLRRLAEASGVELRVHLSPAREEWRRLLATASVVTVAAVREPFGLVSLEAQASARPLVTVNEGGLPETVVPGQTALVSDPDPEPLAQAIATLLADPARARALATAGRDHVRRRFDPRRCGELLESALLDGDPAGTASR